MKYFKNPKAVSDGHLALTWVSTRAFWLAYKATQLKAWNDEKDPDWKAYLPVPDQSEEVRKLLPLVTEQMSDVLPDQLHTLFWLMFDISDKNVGVSPWSIHGNVLKLEPLPQPPAGVPSHFANAHLGDLSRLMKLKRRVFPLR
ncbi:hypothetical protein BH11ARM1_BH11ARM1_15400 [soil metagenome]